MPPQGRTPTRSRVLLNIASIFLFIAGIVSLPLSHELFYNVSFFDILGEMRIILMYLPPLMLIVFAIYLRIRAVRLPVQTVAVSGTAVSKGPLSALEMTVIAGAIFHALFLLFAEGIVQVFLWFGGVVVYWALAPLLIVMLFRYVFYSGILSLDAKSISSSTKKDMFMAAVCLVYLLMLSYSWSSFATACGRTC